MGQAESLLIKENKEILWNSNMANFHMENDEMTKRIETLDIPDRIF